MLIATPEYNHSVPGLLEERDRLGIAPGGVTPPTGEAGRP